MQEISETISVLYDSNYYPNFFSGQAAIRWAVRWKVGIIFKL